MRDLQETGQQLEHSSVACGLARAVRRAVGSEAWDSLQLDVPARLLGAKATGVPRPPKITRVSAPLHSFLHSRYKRPFVRSQPGLAVGNTHIAYLVGVVSSNSSAGKPCLRTRPRTASACTLSRVSTITSSPALP